MTETAQLKFIGGKILKQNSFTSIGYASLIDTWVVDIVCGKCYILSEEIVRNLLPPYSHSHSGHDIRQWKSVLLLLIF